MNNLKKLRKMYHLTVRQVGERSGVNYTRVSYFEHHELSANFKTINGLAKFFNVTTDYLMGESDLGYNIIYEYEDQTDTATVTEAVFEKAKAEYCLWDEEGEHSIIHHIRGTMAEQHFERTVPKSVNINIRELLNAYIKLDDEGREEVKKKVNIILMKREMGKMQKKIEEMENSEGATEKEDK